jgi:uncharacterized protein (TIGR02466 family)
MSYQYIFPTCIFTDIQKDMATEVLPVAIEYLETYGEQFMGYKNHISTYRNIEATIKLNRDPRLLSLTNFIVNEAKKMLDFQNVDHSQYKLTYSMLVNKVGKDSTHLLHAHPGSIISGCFYLKTAPDSPPLIFKDPRDYYKYIYYQPIFGRNSVYSLLPEHVSPVQDGLIMMWPSWLEHEVPLSNSDEDRITIAFNLDK